MQSFATHQVKKNVLLFMNCFIIVQHHATRKFRRSGFTCHFRLCFGGKVFHCLRRPIRHRAPRGIERHPGRRGRMRGGAGRGTGIGRLRKGHAFLGCLGCVDGICGARDHREKEQAKSCGSHVSSVIQKRRRMFDAKNVPRLFDQNMLQRCKSERFLFNQSVDPAGKRLSVRGGRPRARRKSS
jgi:hypothetical protein